MSKEDNGGKGEAADQVAARVRLDYARELGEWADQMPQQPTTMAKSMNDILTETCAKLAKIAACYHLQQAINMATDGQVLSDDAGADGVFENIKNEAKAGMERLGCGAL